MPDPKLTQIDKDMLRLMRDATAERLKSNRQFRRRMRAIIKDLLDDYTLDDLNQIGIWRKAMRDAGFNDLVRETSKRQTQLRHEAEEIWKQYSDKPLPKSAVKRLGRIRQANTYSFKKVEELDVLRFQETVEEAVIKEKSQKWLNEQLKKRTDLTKAHCDTMSRTSIAGFARATNFEKGRIAGIKKWKYMGLLLANTRIKCREWLGRVFTYEEIKQLDNGMLNPVWIHCGGYNCGHRWAAWE